MNENTRPIKILYIIDRLRGFAGTEKHLFQLVKYMDKKTFLCEIIVLNVTSDKMIKKFRSEVVNVQFLNLKKIYGFDALKRFFVLVKMIRHFKPDIVQTFHFMSDTYGVIAAKFAVVPCLISSRRDMGDLKRGHQLFINRIINPFIDQFISVCDRVGEELTRVEKIPSRKIRTIYNGVDIPNYTVGEEEKSKARMKIGIDPTAFVIGIVCIFRPEKDVMLFMEAVKEAKEKINNLFVILVGDGPEQERLEKFAVRNDLEKICLFTGYVENIQDYVKAMDIVCLTPKKNEGLSNAILEEMALGKPIIATDVGGNAELIIHGETGYIIDSGHKYGLKSFLLKLHKESEIRDRMGKLARERAKEVFSIEMMIKNAQTLYVSMINGN